MHNELESVHQVYFSRLSREGKQNGKARIITQNEERVQMAFLGIMRCQSIKALILKARLVNWASTPSPENLTIQLDELAQRAVYK